MRHSHLCIAIVLSLVCVPFAVAQTPDISAQLKAMEDRIKALEAEVQSLKTQSAMAAAAVPAPVAVAAAAEPAPAPPIPATQPSLGGNGSMAKALNPDISFIGDFLGAAGHNNVRGTPAMEFHEGEVGLQAIIDPYARADAFISFSETGVNIEEAFLTFTSLPAGLRLQVGKFREAFGKVNTQHNHVLPWTDRPLMSENLTGGEDGLDDVGFSLTRLLPAPKGIFLEGTAQLFRGDSSDVFTSGRRRDVSVLGHLRGYGDLSESTNLEVGFSYTRGHNDGSPYETCNSACTLIGIAPGLAVNASAASYMPYYYYNPNATYITNLYGTDVSLRWKPLRRAIYNSLLLRNEVTISNRQQFGGARHAIGTYGMAEYRLNRRWTLGTRVDYSERARIAGIDKGFSALITYWPSEFSQIRTQYRFTNYSPDMFFPTRQLANELRFQFLFVMGAHGAHPF